MGKLAFVAFALRQAVESKTPMEIPEMEGLVEILDDIHLDQLEKKKA